MPYKTSFARQGLKVGLELEKMNPTCRWSSFDAIRLGREPDPSVPATIQEKAWSSPIWSDA